MENTSGMSTRKQKAGNGKNLQESMATIIPICLSSVKSANLDSVFQIVSIFLSGILVQVIKIFCTLKNSFLENSTWNSVTSGEFWRKKKKNNHLFSLNFIFYLHTYMPYLVFKSSIFNLLQIKIWRFGGLISCLFFYLIKNGDV